MNSKKKIFLLTLLIVIGSAAAKLTLFRKPFLYAGTLEATKVDLSARLSSTIAEVIPQEGDKVRKGQELITLTCDDVKVASDLADINYRRNLRLFQNGTISPDTLDQVKNKKEGIDVEMSWCSIRSPLDGIVLSRYHEPGEWVSAGTKLLTLANIKDIWAFIYVPQDKVSQIHPGEILTGYLPEQNMRPFQGKVLKINDEAEFTPKNVQTRAERERLVFGIKVSFLESNQDETLKPGMTIEIALP